MICDRCKKKIEGKFYEIECTKSKHIKRMCKECAFILKEWFNQ